MRSLNLNNLLLALLVGLVMVACGKKDNALAPVNGGNQVSVKNGRLAFANEDAFKQFMAYAKEANFNLEYKGKLNAWAQQGFSSLQPEHSQNSSAYVAQTEQRKIAEHNKLSQMYPTARALSNPQGIDDEDALIADPFFASILNEQREVQVGNKVYKYTVEGVFVVNADKVKDLYTFIAAEEAAQIAAPNRRFAKEQEVQSISKDIVLIRPAQKYESMKIVLDNTCTTCNDANQRVDPSQFKMCSTLKKNLWTKVFGPKVECTEYHDKRRRIKTKVWNQNYVLYSSIGISVRAQKRSARVWWANKVDELELGIYQASFRYPKLKVQWPDFSNNYFYTDRSGNMVNQWGQAVGNPLGHPQSIFDAFPIKDKDQEFFSIYTNLPIVKNLFKNGKLVEVKGKDINKLIKSQVVSQVKRYWKKAEKELESKSTLMLAEFPGNTEKDLTVTYIDWSSNKTNENAIRKIFDWNTAQIGFKTNLGDGKGVGFGDFSLKKTAQSYKELLLTGYGVGRRGSTWKGGQVIFMDER